MKTKPVARVKGEVGDRRNRFFFIALQVLISGFTVSQRPSCTANILGGIPFYSTFSPLNSVNKFQNSLEVRFQKACHLHLQAKPVHPPFPSILFILGNYHRQLARTAPSRSTAIRSHDGQAVFRLELRALFTLRHATSHPLRDFSQISVPAKVPLPLTLAKIISSS